MSNTWVTCPEDRDNPSKGGLIPDSSGFLEGARGKGASACKLPLQDGPAAYQVVGRVTAYQAYDG